ncbi:MAG TPA: Fe-Mn family superoxide dismutase [Candidatus Fimivivens sp.]|nr:Fe-Mn family superoxide dismutase [Candidatus Fimivivens sp.]
MYEIQDFSTLLGTPGFSDGLLNDHFALYGGYVKNVNLLLGKLAETGADTPEGAELRRRFGWEWNGMRLHELYFGNLQTGAETLHDGPLKERLIAEYGSIELWERDFRSVGTMRGIGWVILSEDPVNGALLNTWVNEHDGGHLAGGKPLLVMDAFEHAYIRDYGIKRADYIDVFMKAIDWKAVEERL